jgi:hypothetical protein
MADERGAAGVANVTITNNTLTHAGGISTWYVTPTNLTIADNANIEAQLPPPSI